MQCSCFWGSDLKFDHQNGNIWNIVNSVVRRVLKHDLENILLRRLMMSFGGNITQLDTRTHTHTRTEYSQNSTPLQTKNPQHPNGTLTLTHGDKERT